MDIINPICPPTARAAVRTIARRRRTGRSRYDISVATASAQSAMAPAISHRGMDTPLWAAETVPSPIARSRPPTARRAALVGASWVALPSQMRPATSGKRNRPRPMEARALPNQATALPPSIDVPLVYGKGADIG